MSADTRTAFWTWPRIALVLVVLAFTCLGSRALWDPDEGRYTNVAINMILRGDWLVPHRSLDVAHWTKPPLAYWSIAAAFVVFGVNTWAARLTPALSYLACAWLASRIARRVAPGYERAAALVFATMLLPAIASQLVTIDFLLTACETLAMYAYVELRWGDARPRWAYLMWGAFGLAFLAKGPPGLLPLLAVVVSEFAQPAPRRAFRWPAIALFLVVALSWFACVVMREPRLLAYFLGDEVVSRVASNEFGRHGEWYGWLVVYAPTIVLGALPWTIPALRHAARAVRRAPDWKRAAGRTADAPTILLIAWCVLPLIVFCVARSRLPLYVLPLTVPLALLAVRDYAARGAALPSVPLLVWIVLLVALRIGGSHIASEQDARQWADAIRARTGAPIDRVVFVDDDPRYGLRLHLGAEVEDVTLQPTPAPDAAPVNPAFDEDAATELVEENADHNAVWITRVAHWPDVRDYLHAHGGDAHALGAPFRGRVMFDVTPTPSAPPRRPNQPPSGKTP
ncbi:ArnT family glycosyltransferase [Lysobacter claricitrinus]|uniref:ArnT family glycosyltransferase n=1 Tax=Lysobacter claricitrinus TaxID=3367728 RepID=UPI0037DB6A85